MKSKEEKDSSEEGEPDYISQVRIPPYGITRFEKARLIGLRWLELAQGAKPMVEVHPGDSLIDIARREVETGILPLHVRRHLPDGTYCDIPLKVLIEAERQLRKRIRQL